MTIKTLILNLIIVSTLSLAGCVNITDSNQPSTDISTLPSKNEESRENNNSDTQKTLITVEEAQSIAELFCQKPNIGAQAFHNAGFDIKIDDVYYFYFDIIYGSLMGEKPKEGDNMLTSLFVSSKDKSIHGVLKKSDDQICLGEKLN